MSDFKLINQCKLFHSLLTRGILLAGCLSLATVATADSSLGEAANFAILGLNNGTVIINSASSITGNVGYCRNVTSGTNQKVDHFTGAVYVHSGADVKTTPRTFDPSGGLFAGGSLTDAKLDQANADALAASAFYAAYTPSQILGALGDNDDRVITSTGDVNIILLDSLKYKEDVLEIRSRPGTQDVFIFNVLGNFEFANSEIKLTGLSPERVLFNFIGTADIKIKKSGSAFSGTILAPKSTVDYHNPASFNGAIIARDIDLHSDFNINHIPFEPVPPFEPDPPPDD